VRDAMAEVLDRTTLADLLRQMGNARQKPVLMYHI